MTDKVSTAPLLQRAIAGDMRTGSSRNAIAFLVLLAGLAALFSDAVLSMATVWLSSSIYHHGVIAAPISAWMIASRWRGNEKLARSDWAGLPIIAVASAAWIFGRAANVDLLGHAALVVAVWGAFLVAFGRDLALRFAFPLGFLVFMVPAGEELTPALQAWTASAVALLLNLTGVETARDGFMLTTDAGRFEVAESCAGLRFLLASLMISTLVSWFAFNGWRKRATFIALAIGAAILANWLRVYVIVLLATATERKLGVGPEHVLLGWVFYAALLTALVIAARRNKDAPQNRRQTQRRRQPKDQVPAAVVALSLLTASAAVAYEALVVSRNDLPQTTPSAHPFAAEGFRPVAPISDWEAFSPYADARATIGYAAPNAALIVSLASFSADRPDAEIIAREVRAADGVAWRRTSVTNVDLTIDGAARTAKYETIEDVAGEKIDVAVIYWVGDQLYADAATAKVVIALTRLRGEAARGGVIFVAAPHQSNAAPREAIKSFASRLEPLESWLARRPA